VRNITQRVHGHNQRALRQRSFGGDHAATAGLLTALLVGIALPAAAAPCPLELDLSVIQSFEELGARMTRGELVPQEDTAALFALPAYTLFVETGGESGLNAQVFDNVLRHVFQDSTHAAEEGTGEHVRSPKRQDLVKSFTYLRDHQQELQRFLAQYRNTHAGCRIFERLEGFIPAEKMPQQITLVFVPLQPEIRYLDNQLLVDAGLALAAGPDQLGRILASVLYRDIQAPDISLPKDLSGLAAMRATFVHLAFQGVAAYLESFGDLTFDPNHPQLAKPPMLRREAIRSCPRVIENMDKYLRAVLDDEKQMREQGRIIDDLLRGGSSYDATGYAMAMLIVARLGEARLQQTIGDPRAFLEAYQEAALLKRIVAAGPIPEGFPQDLQLLPPFAEDVFPRLLAILPASR
jgi:hypothetical protein